MNILVIGGGRTGNFWATVLSRAPGVNVTLLVRPSQYMYFKDSGPEIVWHDREARPITWPSHDVHVIQSLGELNVHLPWTILPAVRSYAVEEALRPVVTKLQSNLRGLIIPTNGLTGEQAARRAWPEGKDIISASLTLPCERDLEFPYRTHVMQMNGGIGLAYLTGLPLSRHPSAALGQRVVRALRSCHGIEVCEYSSWRSMKYTKIILNILGNTIPAILDEADLEKLYANPDICRLELRLVREALQLKKFLDTELVDLPGYPRRKIMPLVYLARLEGLVGWTGLPARLYQRHIVPRILNGRGGKMPSLLAEIRGGQKRCENLHMDLWQAAGHGRLNNRIGRVLTKCFADSDTRREYTQHPERLVREDR